MNVNLSMQRHAYFWKGVTPEAVGAYLKTLRQHQKQFEESEFALPRPFRLNDEARSRYLALLEDEIRLGECYFELRGRRKELDFGTWVFSKREDRKPRYGWDTPKGDVWARTNGRMQAEIEINKMRTMTRVSLRLTNNSDQLTFYDPPTGGEICHRFLRNEKSIQAEVNWLKQHADGVLRKHLLPKRAALDHQLLRDLLFVD